MFYAKLHYFPGPSFHGKMCVGIRTIFYLNSAINPARLGDRGPVKWLGIYKKLLKRSDIFYLSTFFNFFYMCSYFKPLLPVKPSQAFNRKISFFLFWQLKNQQCIEFINCILKSNTRHKIWGIFKVKQHLTKLA